MKLRQTPLLYVFVDLKVHNVQRIPIILIVLTNKNVALIYSVKFANRKQRIVHFQGASNINCSTVVFITDVCRFS